MNSGQVPLPTRRDTRRLGRAIGAALRPGDLAVFTGTLGSGKTFLIRAICRELGLPAGTRVTSPTFTLVHEYRARVPIVHADLYRLERPEDVLGLGLVEHRDLGAVLLVEWGEPFNELFGGDALVVTLDTEPRSAGIGATGSRSRELAERAFAALA